MTEAEILARIIGGATLDDVVAAFSGRHSERPEYSWLATVERKGEVLLVQGQITCDTVQIGRFARRLYFEHGHACATHEIMEIADEHQERGIAEHCYAQTLRFYDRIGIRYVYLEAEAMGCVVWPQFGFDLRRRSQREMLLRILRDWEVEPLPDLASLLAPVVVDIHTEGRPELGEEALYELEDRISERLPMVLDLRHPVQRTFLINRGILEH